MFPEPIATTPIDPITYPPWPSSYGAPPPVVPLSALPSPASARPSLDRLPSCHLPTPALSTSSSATSSSSSSSLIWPTLLGGDTSSHTLTQSPDDLRPAQRRRGSTSSVRSGIGSEAYEDLLHLAVRHDVERKRRQGPIEGTKFTFQSPVRTGFQPPPAPVTSTCSEPPPPCRAEKDRFVDGLIGTCELAIHSIWGSSAANCSSTTTDNPVLPLRFFIRETLRRSRTSCSTLQLALDYLHRARTPLRARVARAERARRMFAIARAQALEREAVAQQLPTPPASPVDDPNVDDVVMASETLVEYAREVLATSKDPVVCGRRMFLASLMLASKFLQDRNYSTRAWSKISGLPINEINANERALLEILDYDLFVRPELFDNWVLRLRKLAADHDPTVKQTTGSSCLSSPSSSLSISSLPSGVDVEPISPPMTPPLSARLPYFGRSSSNYSPAPSMAPSPRAGPPPHSSLTGTRRFSYDAAALKPSVQRSAFSTTDLTRSSSMWRPRSSCGPNVVGPSSNFDVPPVR